MTVDEERDDIRTELQQHNVWNLPGALIEMTAQLFRAFEQEGDVCNAVHMFVSLLLVVSMYIGRVFVVSRYIGRDKKDENGFSSFHGVTLYSEPFLGICTETYSKCVEKISDSPPF